MKSAFTLLRTAAMATAALLANPFRSDRSVVQSQLSAVATAAAMASVFNPWANRIVPLSRHKGERQTYKPNGPRECARRRRQMGTDWLDR